LSILKIFSDFRKKNREIADSIVGEVIVLYYVLKDPRTPWYTKAIAFLGLSYAVSPLDVIPDFIPLLGYLDDLVIIPGFYFLVKKLTPESVLCDAKERKIAGDVNKYAVAGSVLICIFWILLILFVVISFLHFWKGHKAR